MYDGLNIMIAHNTITDVWGPAIDLEPVATRWEVDSVTVLDNTVGTHAHYFMTAAGASTTNDNLLFEGNTDTAGSMTMLVGSQSTSPPIRSNVRIIDNRADRPNPADLSLITINGNRLVLSGNQAPVRRTAVTLRDSSNVSVTGNGFPGASAVVVATGGFAISQSNNSR